MTSRGTQAFVFDLGNRLSSATGKATYTYDGLGHRVKTVSADGTNKIQVYSPGGQLLYTVQTGGPSPANTAKYVYLNRHVLAELNNGVVQYDHTDALGSPVARTNGAGTLLTRTRYEPYGATAAGTTPTIGFTGHVNDADTGLVNMQARYYDPLAGRMLSIDPVTTDVNSGSSFNRYAYANNNPYRFVDPDGRNPLALRLVYGAAYEAATALGAPILRTMIANVIWNAVNSDDAPGTAVGTGYIYCVSGDKTSSGKDYIGSANDLDVRKNDKSDGRDRNGATIVDTYTIGNR